MGCSLCENARVSVSLDSMTNSYLSQVCRLFVIGFRWRMLLVFLLRLILRCFQSRLFLSRCLRQCVKGGNDKPMPRMHE